ncbi:MAG: TetR/AcrR family transcriptional regulator C-terminal domain-containing protein [Coriobacteriales bacterium]|nr:TetR/AcrR family transcriptional regulator C-terminal domain-containing protein [Coriobacteriales bacterium]
MDTGHDRQNHIESRMKIVHAMDDLMKETPLDKLSTTAICDKAGISRQTFYQCFLDKYDVVDWVLTELTRPTVRNIGITLGWYEGFLRLHRALLEMKDFLANSAKSQDVNTLPTIAVRLAKEDYERAALMRLGGSEIPELIAFQIENFAYTTTQATTRWQIRGMQESPEKIASMMCTLVPRELYNLLDIKPEETREWTVFSEYDILKNNRS